VWEEWEKVFRAQASTYSPRVLSRKRFTRPPTVSLLGGTSARYKVEHDRDDCQQEQEMYQSPGNMKYGKTANPSDYQYDSQNCPYAHESSTSRWVVPLGL
jgi:hypothetical protein